MPNLKPKQLKTQRIYNLLKVTKLEVIMYKEESKP